MTIDPLNQSFKLVSQKLQLEACFTARAYEANVERVFQEVTQLLTSAEFQQRLREKRGCA